MAQVTPLREALDASGLSSRQLAQKIDKHETQVSKWVNGAPAPRVEVALRIARELNTTVDVLWPEPDRTTA